MGPLDKCKGFGYAEISGKLVQWHMNSRICLVCLRLINKIWPTSNMNAIPCLNLTYPTSSQSGTDNKGLCVSLIDLLSTWPIERELRWRSFEYEHLLVWKLRKAAGFNKSSSWTIFDLRSGISSCTKSEQWSCSLAALQQILDISWCVRVDFQRGI